MAGESMLSMLSLAFIILAVSSNDFKFKKREVEIGSRDVKLACRVDENEKGIMWFHEEKRVAFYSQGNSQILQNDDYRIDDDYSQERNLVIKVVRRNMKGEFRCVYAKDNDVIEAYEIIVLDRHIGLNFYRGKKKAMISFSSDPLVVVTEGETVDLWCNSTSIPNPKTSWFIIDADKETQIDVVGRLLRIKNVTKECASKYRCKVENRFNNHIPDTRDVVVSIIFPPEVDISLEEPVNRVIDADFDEEAVNYDVIFNETKERFKLNLTCHALVPNNTNIKWFDGDQLIATWNVSKSHPSKAEFVEGYLYSVHNWREKENEVKLSIRYEAYDGKIIGKRYTCVAEIQDLKDECNVKFHSKRI